MLWKSDDKPGSQYQSLLCSICPISPLRSSPRRITNKQSWKKPQGSSWRNGRLQAKVYDMWGDSVNYLHRLTNSSSIVQQQNKIHKDYMILTKWVNKYYTVDIHRFLSPYTNKVYTISQYENNPYSMNPVQQYSFVSLQIQFSWIVHTKPEYPTNTFQGYCRLLNPKIFVFVVGGYSIYFLGFMWQIVHDKEKKKNLTHFQLNLFVCHDVSIYFPLVQQ